MASSLRARLGALAIRARGTPILDKMEMPEICNFYGIRIEMFYSDHNPPHFHAKYGDHQAEFEIKTLGLLRGWMPPKAQALVIEWASQHRAELFADWELARQHQRLNTIAPLD